MASVLAGRGKLWTTDLAELLADRGNFAVFEGEKRRWLAVLPKGEWKWVVDTGKGSIVPSAINAAVKVWLVDDVPSTIVSLVLPEIVTPESEVMKRYLTIPLVSFGDVKV